MTSFIFSSLQRVLLSTACATMSLVALSAQAIEQSSVNSSPFYVGLVAGFGDTTWSHLVAKEDDIFVKVSTPMAAEDEGGLYGALLGYVLSKNIFFECMAEHYSESRLKFMKYSLYEPAHDIKSQTSVYTMHLKILTPLETIPLRLFASIGLSFTHRHDDLADLMQAGGAFGAGFSHDFNPSWTGELAFQYHTGNAIAELKPVNDYVPFVYSLQAHLIYHFPNHLGLA